MLIKKHSIQNLIESIPLSEHLKRFIDLKRSGSNWLGLCPFHQDSTPSFYVYPKNYHCFSCNAHGSVVSYEMHRTGLSFKESVEQLAQTYHYTLDYESTHLEDKKNNILQKQAEQLEVLKKMDTFFLSDDRENTLKENLFLIQEIQIIKGFYYSDMDLKNKVLTEQFIQTHFIYPLVKENGIVHGFVFLKKLASENSVLENFLNVQFLTINKNIQPCLNWNEARPYAIKEKQLIITFDILDSKLFKEKNIYNVAACPKKIDDHLLKLFSRRVKRLILVIPSHHEGKTFLWQTFQDVLAKEGISVDVLMIPEGRSKRESFFSAMTEEKMRVWLQSAEKISLKVTELFLESLGKEKNKLQSFKQKILPIINKIKEPSTKKALLLDIANRYFYSADIAADTFLPRSLNAEPPQVQTDLTIKPQGGDSRDAVNVVNREVQKNEVGLTLHGEFAELASRSAEFYHKCLFRSKENAETMGYLKSRGLGEEDIKRWKIGYCSSNHDLSKKAQTGIVSQENLSILGIIKKHKLGNNYYDFFHDRIIIPIPNHKGEYVALAGRTFLSLNSGNKNNSIAAPKYINSPESEIFSKSKILFNFYKALEPIIINKYVIVVEGYMDCISLVNAGIDNVVAVMGTALTKFHLEELSQITKRVVLCFDNDKAGQSAAKRTFAASVHFQELDLEYLALPECKDPDEFIKRFGKDKFLSLSKNKNTLLYEKICEWCHMNSGDYQGFVTHVQKEFECLIEAQNEFLKKQVENYVFEKFNISLASFFSKAGHKLPVDLKPLAEQTFVEQELNFNWPVKNPLEMKLLLAMLYLKFSELPERLQNIMLDLSSSNENDEKICAQAIENQFSKTGFSVFLEISSWMLENRHISVAYVGAEAFELFSEEAQILIGFSLSEIKTLIRFHLHELIKDSLSSGISMVLSQNVWNLKNAGFLKFVLRNIKLASQNGVLPDLFEEALLNLEVDYIDSTLKAFSSLHFDNDLDIQFQFLVAERVRCKTKLGNLNLK